MQNNFSFSINDGNCVAKLGEIILEGVMEANKPPTGFQTMIDGKAFLFLISEERHLYRVVYLAGDKYVDIYPNVPMDIGKDKTNGLIISPDFNIVMYVETVNDPKNPRFNYISYGLRQMRKKFEDAGWTASTVVNNKITFASLGDCALDRFPIRESKINTEYEEIADTLFPEYKWISDNVFQIERKLEINPLTKKSKLQSSHREELRMSETGITKYELQTYSTVSMFHGNYPEETGKKPFMDILTLIDLDMLDQWYNMKNKAKANKHFVDVLEEKNQNYFKIKQYFSTKDKKNEAYNALVDPIVDEKGDISNTNISETEGDFEICLPQFSDKYLIFLVFQGTDVHLEKVKPNGAKIYNKKFNNVDHLIKCFPKIIG